MSDSVRSETTATRAFRELETLVRHLADELAVFRRRALVAEARLRELEGQHGGPAEERRQLSDRCVALESENAELKGRLDTATSRTQQMLDRVRFIRQQTQNGTEAR